MTKYVATPVGSGFGAQSNLNQNFEDIEDNFQRVLYRDGSTPNQMEADLDMNDNDIVNVNNINTSSLAINGQQVVANETFVTPLPDPTGQSGKFIRSDGVSASWQNFTKQDVDEVAVIYVDTFATMKALTGVVNGAHIHTTGYTTAGKGAGKYRYNSAGSGTANFLNVQPDTLAGRFELLDAVIDPYHAGCVMDGTTNDYAALKEFLEVVTDKTKVGRAATCKANQTATITMPVNSFIDFGGMVIDGSGSSLSAGQFHLKCADTFTSITTTNGAITLGDTSVTLTSVSGISSGDVLQIYNSTNSSFSAYRAEYRAGEFLHVGRVSGSAVLPMNPVYDTYTTGKTVFKLGGGTAAFSNLKIIQQAGQIGGLQLDALVSPRVSGIRTIGSTYLGVEFKRCYDVNGYGPGFQASADVDDEYGWSISNCQGGVIFGNFFGGRHSINIGGGDYDGCVPNRGITLVGGLHGNMGAIGSGGLHGNCEDIKYIGWTFSNGAALSGKNITFDACNFRGKTDSGVAANSGEVVGGYYNFNNCTFETTVDPNASNFGVVSFSNLTSSVKETVFVNLNNCNYKAPSGTLYMILASVNGSTFPINVAVNGGVVLAATGLTQFVRLARTSGVAAFDYIHIKGISGLPTTPGQCAYMANAGTGLSVTKYRLPQQMGSVSVTTSTGASQADQAVTYTHTYPITPYTVISNRSAFLGADAISVARASGTTTGFTARYYTCNATNFDSATAVVADWISGLDD